MDDGANIESRAPKRPLTRPSRRRCRAVCRRLRLRHRPIVANDGDTIYRAVFEVSPDAIVVHDGSRVLLVNRAGANLLGAERPDEIIGQPLERFVHPRSRARVAARVEHMRSDGGPVPFDEEILTRLDGTAVDVDVAAAPLRFRGRPAFVAISRDTTERRRAREVYEQYLQAVSHDLQTPLAALLLRVQTLERSCAQLRVDRGASQAIKAAGRRMMNMLDELRDVAKIETGQLRLRLEPVSLPTFFAEFLAHIEGALKSERVRIECGDEVPRALGDRERLERVVLNLVSNALKYSPEDRPVHLGAEAREREVVISVTDEGPGVPVGVAARIFDRFVRGDAKSDGLGLGLCIAKGIVEAHHGRLWLENSPGRGACFRFTLPRA